MIPGKGIVGEKRRRQGDGRVRYQVFGWTDVTV
jgi:hypothetical protein